MTEYVVRIRFWLRAYDSRIVMAVTDTEAFHMARGAARETMADRTPPEEIDIAERHDGLIAYIDRRASGRSELAEAVAFDGNRPRNPDVHGLIARLAALDDNLDASVTVDVLRDLIGTARALQSEGACALSRSPQARDEWSVEAVYIYSGDPRTLTVCVTDEAGAAHALVPRFDLRNHSPTGLRGATAAPDRPSLCSRSCAMPCTTMSGPSNSTRTSRELSSRGSITKSPSD